MIIEGAQEPAHSTQHSAFPLTFTIGLDFRRRVADLRERMASVPSSAGGPYGVREIRNLYPAVTDNHLRYLEKWGLVRKSNKPRERRDYSFADLTTIKQVAGELERGTPLRIVLRSMLAERLGQLELNFVDPHAD